MSSHYDQLNFEKYIYNICKYLKIPDNYVIDNNLLYQQEPKTLVSIGQDVYGRHQWLAPSAANKLTALQKKAAQCGLKIGVVSAYRSVQYQVLLFERKLAKGLTIENILQKNTPPGFSEHHTGMAVDFVDLTTHPRTTLAECFEQTDVFNWLMKNADQCCCRLSFPKDNPFGLIYEPWHWRFMES